MNLGAASSAPSQTPVPGGLNYNQPLNISAVADNLAVVNASGSPAAVGNFAFVPEGSPLRPEVQQSALKSRPLGPDSRDLLQSLNTESTPQTPAVAQAPEIPAPPQPPQPQPGAQLPAAAPSAGAQAVARAEELLKQPAANALIQEEYSRCLQILAYLIDLKQSAAQLQAQQHRQLAGDPAAQQMAKLASLAAQPPGQLPPPGGAASAFLPGRNKVDSTEQSLQDLELLDAAAPAGPAAAAGAPPVPPAVLAPAPAVNTAAAQAYRERIARQSEQLNSEIQQAAAAASGGQGQLSAAEAERFEGIALPLATEPMSLEEARRINSAVDQRLRQEQAAEPVSPLAGNFAAAPQAEPQPAHQEQPQEQMPPVDPQTQMPALAPQEQISPMEPQAQMSAPAPQNQMPPPQPPADQAAANGLPPFQAPQKAEAGPALPEYLQDLPPLEDDYAYMGGAAAEEGEEPAPASSSPGPDLLLADLPEAHPAPQAGPQQPYTEPAGSARPQDRRGRGGGSAAPRVVQTLPAGYSLPRFAGLRPLSADDYYPQLAQSDPWYRLIVDSGFKNGPDLNVLLFSALQHEPDEEGVMAITCSFDHRDYVEGSRAVERFNQQFSQHFGRQVEVKLSYVPGVPPGAPCAAADSALLRDTTARRQELSRDAALQELCALLGENINELPLQLYVPENSAETK